MSTPVPGTGKHCCCGKSNIIRRRDGKIVFHGRWHKCSAWAAKLGYTTHEYRPSLCWKYYCDQRTGDEYWQVGEKYSTLEHIPGLEAVR